VSAREIGVFRAKMPRVEVELPTGGGSLTTEFVLDTGFNGDLTIPLRVIQRLDAAIQTPQVHRLAGGELIVAPTYLLTIPWLGRVRTVEVIALEGNALLGTGLLLGTQITIDAVAGGEVIIETL
jgi:clan AA aspartic protease